MARSEIRLPMNRVEGDLELRLEIEDGVVADAWCCGTLYRGFERLLVGRAALDGLVLTPRICGICSVSHLAAAAHALDGIHGADVPPGATTVRNVCLAVEHLQSDVRHTFLSFAPDLVNGAYAAKPSFAEAVRRYAPLAGSAARRAIEETKRALEVVAILGGQWPHPSFMVPGGISSVPSRADLLQCCHILSAFRAFYEERILGGPIEEWQEITDLERLEAWLDENPDRASAEMGFFLRYGRELGLHTLGRGRGRLIGYGGFPTPDGSAVKPGPDGRHLLAAGVIDAGPASPFDPGLVAESDAWSRFVHHGDAHPSQGRTEPDKGGVAAEGYTWSKAPRYDGAPAETGPIADLLLLGDPLTRDLVQRFGVCAFTRQFARLARPARLLPAVGSWLAECRDTDRFYRNPGPIPDGAGAGLVQAPRGSLGHWVRVEDGRIASYQIVSPTTWNASPRDAAGVRGPMEEALVGTPAPDLENPVEVGHIVRSFDPCLVCTVHVSRPRGPAHTV